MCVPLPGYDPYKPEKPISHKEEYIARQKLQATIIICVTVVVVTAIITLGVVYTINKRRQLVHNN